MVFLSFQAKSLATPWLCLKAAKNLSILLLTFRYPEVPALLHRGSFSLAPFEFEHHAFDMAIILMPAQELQTFLPITPAQDFDGLLTRTP